MHFMNKYHKVSFSYYFIFDRVTVIGVEPQILERHTNKAKGQYNAELTLSPRLHVKPLITAIKAIES